MSTSTRIHILLPEDTLSRLDMKRGLVPRSSYIRDLVERALMMDGSMPEAPPLVNETKAMAHDLGKPARKIYVEPIQKHVHTWKRGNIFDTCSECGETKRH